MRDIIPRRERKRREHELTLWLPTTKMGPVPSPGLLHEWQEDRTDPELRPWTVKGVWLESPEAFDLLIALNNVGEKRIHLGSDSRYWLHVLNLVLEILAQQKLRPAMLEIRERREVHYEARWQPVLDSEQDARRLVQLAAAMPPAVRAGAPTPDEAVPPRVLLDSFLNHMSDAGARAWGARP